MIRVLIPLTAIAVAGCTHVDPVAPGKCDGDLVQRFVGRDFAAPLHEEMRKASGSQSVRVIRPGDAVTMDYREDRLNIGLDARGKVESARCG